MGKVKGKSGMGNNGEGKKFLKVFGEEKLTGPEQYISFIGETKR